MPKSSGKEKAPAARKRVQVRDLKSRNAANVRGGGRTTNLISDCERA